MQDGAVGPITSAADVVEEVADGDRLLLVEKFDHHFPDGLVADAEPEPHESVRGGLSGGWKLDATGRDEEKKILQSFHSVVQNCRNISTSAPNDNGQFLSGRLASTRAPTQWD